MSKRLPDPAERIAELLRGFKLPTMADELVPRLCTAGHEGALVTIAEVLGLEEDARQGRRVERLRRAATGLPPANSRLPTACASGTSRTEPGPHGGSRRHLERPRSV